MARGIEVTFKSFLRVFEGSKRHKRRQAAILLTLAGKGSKTATEGKEEKVSEVGAEPRRDESFEVNWQGRKEEEPRL